MFPRPSARECSPRYAFTSPCPMPPAAAGGLHLDAQWSTAGAETSERQIHRRSYRTRSSRLASLPQASRLYRRLPPPASTRSLQMPAEPYPPEDHPPFCPFPDARCIPPVLARQDVVPIAPLKRLLAACALLPLCPPLRSGGAAPSCDSWRP